MHINLDHISRDWSSALGDRAFAYDAFLSHNRQDGSSSLAQRLREHGTRVWHDDDALLPDRRVHEKVWQAARASRFVVVCIGPTFENSAWCKAEYVPALSVEEQYRCVRVLVVVTAAHASIPKALEHCARFGPDEDAKLADYVSMGNKLPFSVETVSLTTPMISETELQKLAEEAQTIQDVPSGSGTPGSDDVSDRAIRRLRVNFRDLAIETASSHFCEELFLVRNICDQGPESIPAQTTLEGRILRAICQNGCLSPNTDNRANALMLLAAIDTTHSTDQSLRDVLEFLRREHDGSVISTINRWFKDIGSRLTQDQFEIIEMTALRSPDTFRYWEGRELARRFRDCIRCRLAVREGLGDFLSREERLNLLEQRLEYLLSRPDSPQFVDTLGIAGAALGVSETEIVVRDLCSVILRLRLGDTELASDVIGRMDLLSRSVACFSKIVRSAKKHAGWPLLGWEKWALDFIIKPLGLIFSAAGVLRSETANVLTETCHVLEKSKVSNEVSSYRTYIKQLLDGRSQRDAVDQLRHNLDNLEKDDC